MHLTEADMRRIGSPVTVAKAPAVADSADLRDPAVVATVSEMLRTISADGMDAVLRYARDLDGFTGSDLLVGPAELARAPEHGQDTDAVLLELGLDYDEILAHKASGAIL